MDEGECCRLWVGAALAMAEGTAGVRSAGGADKAIAAASEALRPRVYGKAGGACAGSMHCCKRASEWERSLSRKECDLARGTDERRRDLSGHGNNATD